MTSIYVLQLEHNKYYVGKSTNPVFRLDQHLNANGSAWTTHHKPLNKNFFALFSDCDDFDEDKYTLKYMAKYGIDNVRGGSFCQLELSEIDKQTIQKMLIGTQNLCFTCGNYGHFAKKCTNSTLVEEEQITYEHQRWYPFIKWSPDLLLTDRPKFSSKDGKIELRKESFILQSNQQIVKDWCVDTIGCTDTDGWMYAFVFQDPVYNLKCQSDNFVRRRKWVRIIKTPISNQTRQVSDQNTDDKKIKNIDTPELNIDQPKVTTGRLKVTFGQPWDQKEELQLKTLYVDNNLSIKSIAQIHNRTPGGIVARLKKLNLLNDPNGSQKQAPDSKKHVLEPVLEPEFEPKSEQNDKTIKKIIKCFKCGKFGHTSSTCYSKIH